MSYWIHETMMPLETKLKNTDDAVNKLKLSTVESWFARIEADSIKPTDPGYSDLANSLISRFGLQNTQDVLTFWRTTAGKAIKAMILERLVELNTLKVDQAAQAQENRLKRERYIAFLLLGLMYMHDVKADRVKQTIEQQIKQQSQKRQERNKAKLKQDNSQKLNTTLAYYLEAEASLQQELQDKTSLLETLIHTLNHQLPQQKQIIEKRYDLFETYLNDLKEIEETVNSFLQNHSREPFNTDMIDQQISTLEEAINADAEKIGKLLEEEKDHEAQELLAKTNAQNLQVTALRDMLSVIQGEKLLYNLNGDITNSLTDAKFILTKDLKIVKDGDNFYLLSSTQSLQDLTLEEKLLAMQKFERHQPEMMETHEMVQLNHQQETDWHTHQCEASLAEQSFVKEQITHLTDQLIKNQTAQSQLTETLSQQPPALSPVSTQRSNLNHSYTQIVCAHAQEGFPQGVIDGFKQRLTRIKDKTFSEKIAQLEALHDINPEMMSTLLSNKIPEDAKAYLVQEMGSATSDLSSTRPKN